MTKTWFNVENSSQQEEPGDGVKESLNKRFGILYVHVSTPEFSFYISK